MGLAVPAVTASMATNHERQHQRIVIQELLRGRQKMQKIINDKDLTIQQKEAQMAAQDAKNKDLEHQLQTKVEEEARIAAIPPPVTGGLGGNFVGNSLAWGGLFNTFAPGNCTAYIASLYPIPGSWGNANEWNDHAVAEGYRVDENPTIGSIAQTDYGYYGHVGLTIAINGNQVELREANVYGLGVVDERWVNLLDYRYIHFTQ